jgi:curved DNA-binding protein CbpA
MNIDNFHFQVTTNPYESNSCILWYMDSHNHISFKALGKFSGFDRRRALSFVVKYATSMSLRSEIERKKFEIKLDSISNSYFEQIAARSRGINQEKAYRELFNLDETIDRHDLVKRMKMMAKKFHPDVGGDNKAMTIINEAYSYLAEKAV